MYRDMDTRPPPPRSCDTFVFVAGGPGGPSCTLFGKNSDRPAEEEHEVVYIPAQSCAEGSTVKCTYIEIPQAASTLAVVLSKPRWLWGCEMGANEHGVVGGNEAVSSLLCSELGSKERLLGMDLLRLALERGRTAKEAVEVCTTLLEKYGQGGDCSEDSDGWTYENGFLFADATEAYVLETAGVHHWAAEQVPPGAFRNISNGLSIRSNLCGHSPGLKELCTARGWWRDGTPFDWKAVVGSGGSSHANLKVCGREKAGLDHMQALARAAQSGKLAPDNASKWITGMADALRDEDSGICFSGIHGFITTGSQISWIPSQVSLADHLFTCSSDPSVASYKRFRFPAEPSVVQPRVGC
eukprot:TRINITY_DN27055_c0_g1_i7.p1 TRINITY_DN27055_c0_g1~~TRINITY_DN27055_c0_g1_i7.p1  ORF type:complete len:355 (-),score=64.98 TRINITY_DN27055_c0_g1_i7:77-1141(-)